eukprot:TRINITY_DN24396_c0_g1_i1.p1 TRINITY_DN24396_c0_g1~~TRINITY_DN24396_c0_g1_i1.p1  ORF type:complete len:315 (+),score=52.46 TRINITY_DN24396_c0_g1_i1:144-1088(+)
MPRHEALPKAPLAPAQEFSVDGAFAVAYAADVDSIIACTPRQIVVWDASTGEHLRQIDCGGGVQAMVYALRVRAVVTGGREGRLTVWDLESGAKRREMCTGGTVEALAYAQDLGLRGAVICGEDAGAVAVWDLESGWMLSLMRRPGSIRALAYAPSCGGGERGQLIVGGCARQVAAWDCERETASWEYVCDTQVTAVAASATLRLVAVGELSGRVVVRDLQSGIALWSIEDRHDESSFLEDRALCALVFVPTSGSLLSMTSHAVIVWDIQLRSRVRKTLLAGAAKAAAHVEALEAVLIAESDTKVAVRHWQSLV